MTVQTELSLTFAQYRERQQRRRRSPHTQRAFFTAAVRLDSWLRAQGLAAETAGAEDIEDFYSGLALAPTTKAMELSYVQAAYNYAAKQGRLRHNPALDVQLERVPDREPRIIPAHELRAIKARTHAEREWVFFHLLAYAGLRRAETTTLRWDDGGEDGSVLRLTAGELRIVGKGGKLRYVPIHPALAEVLNEHRERLHPAEGEWVVPATGANGAAPVTVTKMVKALHPTYTPHDYRRTVATSLGDNGVPEPIIDRIMGWAPRSIYRRFYRGGIDAQLQHAILKLYANDPLD